MPVSNSTEHWIKPDALTINLNHFGDPDYLQVSVLAGAVVMVFKQDVIGYNAAHNYRTWPLEAANTYLETTSAYNVYARLTRSEVNARALVVYDTVLRDIEGREITYAEDGSEVLGEANPESFFVFLGQISASVNSGGSSVQREWIADFRFGNLNTNQYQNEEAGGEWTKMFRLNKVTDFIEVLKTISSATFKKWSIKKGDTEKFVTDIKRSDDSDEDVPISDESIPTTKYVQNLNDDRYLRKDKDDRSVGTIASDKGFLVGNADRGMSINPETNIVTAVLDRLMEVLNIQSQEFAMGEWGNGFILKYDKNTGQSYFEVDRMLVRKVAYFVELIIKQLSHVGGQLILSPASMRCSRVEEYGEYYRCYFENERDGKTINNEFKVGDQARAQSFNVKEGTNHNVSSQYYWRLVVGTGDNYIDLSKIDCDAGSLPPLAGDDIVQLGNRTDPERQNAIILSTVGEDAPSFKQYEGIQYYTLAGKEVTVISPKGNVITGDFLSKSGKDLLGYIDDLCARLDDVQYQTDKHYTIWFYDYNPTLENYPASEWMDDDAKREHVQDIFYNEEDGLAFRFLEVSEGVFVWNDITDHETIKALEKAAKAQKTADGKIRNFVAQPVPPYDEGDRWSNASYGELYDNDDLVCVTSKAEGEVFDIADWQPTSGQDSAFKKKFYSEVARLDERITLSVGEGSTTAEAIKNAQAAAKAANDAAATAQNTANAAQNTANTAQNTANAANKRSTDNASAISVQTNSISLLNGAFADVNGQKVLTSAAGATILSDVAKIYATSEGVTAALETKVSFDPKTSKVTSNIVLSADQINLDGAVTYSMLAPTFKTDYDGKATTKALDNAVTTLNDTISSLQTEVDKKASTESLNTKVTELNTALGKKADSSKLGSLAYIDDVANAALSGSTLIVNGYLNTDYCKVKTIEATKGTIGGFDIGEKSLTNNAGDVSLSIGNLTGTKFVALNNEYALRVRYDGATALSAYSSGTNGIAIQAQGQTGALAIRSVGSAEMIARSSESITISGLALAYKKGTTFTGASNTDVSTGWVDFLVATGNFELPSASNCEGKILFVKANGSITITSASPIVNCDGTGYYGTNSNGKYSKTLGSTALFYLSDGSVWYEFRCI